MHRWPPCYEVGCTWDTQSRVRDRQRDLHGSTFNVGAGCARVCVCVAQKRPYGRGETTRAATTSATKEQERVSDRDREKERRPPSLRSPCHTALNVIGSALEDAYSIVIISLTIRFFFLRTRSLHGNPDRASWLPVRPTSSASLSSTIFYHHFREI